MTSGHPLVEIDYRDDRRGVFTVLERGSVCLLLGTFSVYD